LSAHWSKKFEFKDAGAKVEKYIADRAAFRGWESGLPSA
jgi:hypothetical protein